MKLGNSIGGILSIVLFLSCSKHAPATSDWLEIVVTESSTIACGEWELSRLEGMDSISGQLRSSSWGQIEFDLEGLLEQGDLRAKDDNLQVVWSEGGVLLRLGPAGWEGVVKRSAEPFLSEWYTYSAKTLEDLRVQVAFTVRGDARQMIIEAWEEKWQVTVD